MIKSQDGNDLDISVEKNNNNQEEFNLDEFQDFDSTSENTDELDNATKKSKSVTEKFREDQKQLNNALDKLSKDKDSPFSGVAKNFGGMLGGDDETDPNVQKKQDEYLGILSDSLIDLLSGQFKFLQALKMKQNIAITEQVLDNLKKGKGGKIPMEDIETALEISKKNNVLVDEAIAQNKEIEEESKEVFSSGLADYGSGTLKMIGVAYATKEYVKSLKGGAKGINMLGNLASLLVIAENVPTLATTFLSTTESLAKYSSNKGIPVPKEISRVKIEKEKEGFSGFN